MASNGVLEEAVGAEGGGGMDGVDVGPDGKLTGERKARRRLPDKITTASRVRTIGTCDTYYPHVYVLDRPSFSCCYSFCESVDCYCMPQAVASHFVQHRNSHVCTPAQ